MLSRVHPRRPPRLLPSRKPMAPARRVSLFDRDVRVRLSDAAIEILFDVAWVLSEGQVERGRFDGSTMITIELTRAAARISDECDLSTARDVERLLTADPRIGERACAVALAEAERVAGRGLRDQQVDLRVRRIGRHFHLDMDVEAMTQETP